MLLELFVVRDNATRWNSSYLSIHRALKLKSRIKAFLDDNQDDLQADTLTEAEWQQLADMEIVLAPFQSWTKRLEGHAKDGAYGSIWEAMPALESLIKHLDEMKKVYTQRTHPELAASINLAWSKLDEYYIKLDHSPAYAAALLLHPQFRLQHFKNNWKGSLLKYLRPMQDACRQLYESTYQSQSLEIEEEEEETDFAQRAINQLLPKQVRDEYKTYIEGDRILKTPDNLFEWWNGQSHVPSVRQMAFDLLSIPATSCECERVFSGAKKTISDYRGRLGADIIEALECDGAWLRAKV